MLGSKLVRKDQFLDNPEKWDKYVYKYGRIRTFTVPRGKAFYPKLLEWECDDLHYSSLYCREKFS